MTSRPIVTTINSANPNQPSIIAVVPTPDFTLPLPKSCAMVAAATEAVCCYNTETRTKIDATKMRARATCETGRDGNGFTERSETLSSISSSHPGKVERRIKQMKAEMIATMLVKFINIDTEAMQLTGATHIKYGKTMLSLKVLATQM